MKEKENFINYYINLDKKIIEIRESLDIFKQSSNLASSQIHVSLIKGNQFIDEKNKKIYKVIGNRLFKKKYGALILAKNFLELNFFLPFEVVYHGENFSIISQELVELKTKLEIKNLSIKTNNFSLIQNNLEPLIQDDLQSLIYKDYFLEYEKILSLIKFLNVLDIAAHNIGFNKEGKIVCFDLEPFKDPTIDELKYFLIQNNCYDKISEYPEIFYLIYE